MFGIHHIPLRRQGVSLVEALVALAIMSIGMLALVGVQSTMRMNSDLAKQRTEATRIASEEIELVRSYISMAVVPGQPGVSYDEIVSRVVAGYQPPDGIGNTTYSVDRKVTDDANSAQKIISVKVEWKDRTNQTQTVTVDSTIGATDPAGGACRMAGGCHPRQPPLRRGLPLTQRWPGAGADGLSGRLRAAGRMEGPQ